jgi:hypothetical protein
MKTNENVSVRTVYSKSGKEYMLVIQWVADSDLTGKYEYLLISEVDRRVWVSDSHEDVDQFLETK